MKDAEAIRISEQADLAFYEEEIYRLEKVINEEIKPQHDVLEASVLGLRQTFEQAQKEYEQFEREQPIRAEKIEELKLK